MLVREALYTRAVERGLRQSTVLSYERLLGRVGVLDLETTAVTPESVAERLWAIDSPNTRRSAVVALRAVLGLSIKIPRSIPRRYVLPDEDTLRLALLTSPHETRGLLMLYCGLRVGEACAITGRDLLGDRLRVDKQVQQLHVTGKPTTLRVVPVKAYEADVAVPRWLVPLVAGLSETAKPDCVRESLRRAGKKVGVDLNPHLLRHACATILLERGVPVRAVSEHLRHSDISTTLRTYAQHDTEGYVRGVFG